MKMRSKIEIQVINENPANKRLRVIFATRYAKCRQIIKYSNDMKKLTLLIFLSLSIFTAAFTQSCLPDGITFTSQAEIDNFQTNYPNCTEISGEVLISGGDDITNFDGLNMITSIGSRLVIENCVGLHNLSGLANLINIDGGFNIIGNNLLYNFEGLNNLTSIGGYFGIYANDSLSDLTSLSNLTSIGGKITIINNKTLQNLFGLENINEGTITNLDIYNNQSLSICNVQSICDYLVSPNGTINIYDNSTGCNTPSEIANQCGITLNCLPFGNYYLRSQADIDNFFSNYPDCFDLKGKLHIRGNNIKNLLDLYGLKTIETEFVVERCDSLVNFEGLNTLSHIHGNFWVGKNYPYYGNSKLTNFSGLDSLTSIGGYFSIKYNESLIDFSGLENLTTIGQFHIQRNYSLTSLTGLNNVDSIYNGFTIYGESRLHDLSEISNLKYVGTSIRISHTDSLTSLTGLDNINTNDIWTLTIDWNDQLSICDVKSICEYLDDPLNSAWILGNSSGCYNRIEVVEACEIVSSPIFDTELDVLFYPNPAKNILYISNHNVTPQELIIYNYLGQKVKKRKDPCRQIDISMLEKGIYILEIISTKSRLRKKLIIQ